MEKRRVDSGSVAGKTGVELFNELGLLPGTVLTHASLRERFFGAGWDGDAWDAYVLTRIEAGNGVLVMSGVRRDRYARGYVLAEAFAVMPLH